MPLTNAPAMELVDSTGVLDDSPALRARAEEDGYLFFRGLLPADDVLHVRADIMAVLDRHGLRSTAQDPLDGRVDLDALSRVPDEQMRLDIGMPTETYHDVQRLESVHRLPHHPRLLKLYRTIFDRDVLVHPRHIIRMVTAHPSMVPTPIHQDFPLIQGTSNTWTCWFPAGDCPRSLGGLAVLRASHRLGYLPIQFASGAGGIEAQLCPHENQWLTTDYRVGDVLTFPSYTVHKGMPSQQRDQIRLSLDVRYQAMDEPIEEKSLLPHCDLSWEDLYAGWQDSQLKYYWRRHALKMIPWNDSYMQPSRRIC